MTSVAGAASITFKIEGYDTASGVYYNVLTGAAISSTGTTVFKVGFGFQPVPNLTANDFVPGRWKITITHATGDNIAYSLGVWLYG